MKIWIVQGTTGEYSDRFEWIVGAWPTEAEAQARVAELARLYQEAGIERMTRWTPEWEKAMEEFKKIDRNFDNDYTGTRWFLAECELHQSPREGSES